MWANLELPDIERTGDATFDGLVEELGELANARRKLRRAGTLQPTTYVEAEKDAIGDLVVYLAGYCTACEYDLQEIVEKTWDHVAHRDAKERYATPPSA